ncbi:hypothetical protein BDZ91DRAFT_797098 [Kalaharituber pfeilii]|nr:hypothetical protein BDZ91DRAFT_797098 [Kalaharituber pfeilii]
MAVFVPAYKLGKKLERAISQRGQAELEQQRRRAVLRWELDRESKYNAECFPCAGTIRRSDGPASLSDSRQAKDSIIFIVADREPLLDDVRHGDTGSRRSKREGGRGYRRGYGNSIRKGRLELGSRCGGHAGRNVTDGVGGQTHHNDIKMMASGRGLILVDRWTLPESVGVQRELMIERYEGRGERSGVAKS